MSGPHFGSRVIGNDAYDKAVRENKGGASAFGVRVTGAITGDGPVATAKRATEHGPLVVAGAQQTDTKGNPGEGVSIDELRNILAENPTQLDNMYEAELARESGPRSDALHIIREVERGIKGAGRAEILNEIASLLGETAAQAASRADLNSGFLKAAEERQQRAEENALLGDADRVKALKEREDNLNAVKDSRNEGTRSQLPSSAPDTLAQAREAAGITPEKTAKQGQRQTTPTKPEGPIQPETQSAVQPLVPKGETGDEDEENGEDEPTPDELENSTVADLEAYLGDEEVAKLKERKGGRVLKADLLRAAKRKQRTTAK